ncbi:phosducin family protein [Microthyrium microscopicum]|uniref:Phosducin family protein n=1 Tax=Microthyrium microscopicum TaxID=703497 RepID=A0A6A6UU46_9PEZI|nr:phosducin family protein [Microthyrium microscopicum]
MDAPVNVPIDHPDADTEWNDILRKHGVIPEKPPSPTPMIEEALVEARRLMHENRLEGKDLDELDELEDDEDEDFLNSYRQKRIAEMSAIRTAAVYNQVYPLQKPDYAKEVTEESAKAFIFVLLTSPTGTNVESRILVEIWRQLAYKFGDIKFCQIQADLCIEGYPERNTPTILIYRNGDIKRQIVTLRELKGLQTKQSDLEQVLIQVGALKHSDHRVARKEEEEDPHPTSLRSSKPSAVANDEDSDWE